MAKLQKAAKTVGLASMWAVQQENPSTPVWVGPLVPADVMLAGFRAGAQVYKTLVNNVNVASTTDTVEFTDFSWGKAVEAVVEWSKSVRMIKRPLRKPKKYSPSMRTPPRPPARVTPSSPSQVRRWYAAKDTDRPGAYVHKLVAESYNVSGKGTIKMFRSLAKLRAWMNTSNLKMYFETECNPVPLPDAQEQTPDDVLDDEEYYAIKGGKEAGIFPDMASALQAKERGGGAFAVFSSKSDAEEYIRPNESYVVWAGRKIGIMAKAECVKSTQRLPDAQMCGPLSQTDATAKWKEVKARAKVISASVKPPVTPTKPIKKKKQTPKKRKFVYAVAKGRVPGVYDTWEEAEKQVKGVKPNLYAKFRTKKQAQEYVDSHATSPTTGEDEDVQEDGESEEDKQGESELQIEIPEMAKLQEAEDSGQTRVFACHTDIGTARVALSFEDAIRGVSNPSVQVINSESTLLDNLAEAEVRLKKDKSHFRKSLQDRLAEARARAGAASHATKSTGNKKTASRGQLLDRTFVGISAVGRAKETRMITYHFLSEFEPIETCYDQVPFLHELDEDMDLPDTKAAFNPAASFKDLSMKEFFTAKEKAMPTWKLMGFQEFMSFCRKAQRMCQTSSRKGAVANAAALGELMDVGLRTYRTMDRLGELGEGDIRFKARMYLHLQYMSIHRVFHASAIAMTVFADATDPFVARLPGQSGATRRRYGSSAAATTSSKRKPKLTPICGCYKCPSPEHFANDPMCPNASLDTLTNDIKDAILKRVRSSTMSAAAKSAEEEKVRAYWSQHGL